MENVFKILEASDNPVIAILASLVVLLSGVVVYQWQHTMKCTVPKWIWDEYTGKVDALLQTTKIIEDRLPRASQK